MSHVPDIIYADNAATTKIRPEVLAAYNAACETAYGNPSSQHSVGKAGHDALEWARTKYARYMSVDPSTIYFTSCGTESNNIAIRSVLSHMRNVTGNRTIIVTSSVEHSSVRKTAELAAGGKQNHIMVPVDGRGYVDEAKFQEILSVNGPNIAMVSIILAQNEVGTLQRIPNLVALAKRYAGPDVPFHTDATQAFGKYYINPDMMGVDLMTASAHKFHGPRGVGLLYARQNILDPALIPMSGGGQERGCRSGTENVPAIVASAVALECMLGNQAVWQDRKQRVKAMRDSIFAEIAKHIPGIAVNGDPSNGLYNLLSVSLPGGVNSADIVKLLDQQRIMVGSGSACNKGRPSEGMLAMGRSPEAIQGTLRFSLSEFNTPRECQLLAAAVVRAWVASSRRA
jgi:cysteine desulfurase